MVTYISFSFDIHIRSVLEREEQWLEQALEELITEDEIIDQSNLQANMNPNTNNNSNIPNHHSDINNNNNINNLNENNNNNNNNNNNGNDGNSWIEIYDLDDEDSPLLNKKLAKKINSKQQSATSTLHTPATENESTEKNVKDVEELDDEEE